MAQTTDNTGQYIKYAFMIGGAFLGFIALKKLGETFGLIQTKAEANVDTASEKASGDSTIATDSNNPYIAFNGNYAYALVKAFYKKYPKGKWMNNAQLGMSHSDFLKLAKQLFDAKGLFDDDEDSVYGAFRKIQTQYQLSILSGIFYFFYKKDLLEYLKKFMNADEMDKLLSMIKNYPQYFTDRNTTK